MALTISTHPDEVIINAPEFTVDTSLTEGASYQNLRIRATIYIGGEAEAVAVLEQPDGVNDWDLFDILKSFTGKCDEAVGGTEHYIQPTPGSELLTAWTNQGLSTLTSTLRDIALAVQAAVVSAFCRATTDLGATVAGDVCVIGLENDFVDTGVNKALLYYSINATISASDTQVGQYAGLSSSELQPNHIYFALISTGEATATPYIGLGNTSGEVNFAGTVTVHKIGNLKNNPGLYFKVEFEEVYENTSDVTTIGDDAMSDTLLFIPAKVRPGEDFETDFLANGAAGEALSRTNEADSLYIFGEDMEKRLMFVTTSAYTRVSVVADAGTEIENDVPNMGWGIVIVSDASTPTYPIAATDETVGVIVSSIANGGGIIHSVFSFNINTELKCFSDIKVLSFIGDLGEETILFRGLHTETGRAEKSYHQTVNRVRKVLRAYRFIRHKLRTLVETQEVRKLLHELIYTEFDVWMFDSDETAGYKDVAVVDDDTIIGDRNELIESSIDIEYYE